MLSKRIKKRSGITLKRKFPPKIFLILIVVLFISLVLIFARRLWEGDKKFTIVIKGEEYVKVVVLDPVLEEINIIEIPGDTKVTVARQMGTWKIGSVWKLGYDNNLEGELLSETVAKYFKFPNDAWADSQASDVFESSLIKKAKFVFSTFETNMNMMDKIRIGYFVSKVDRVNKVNTRLEETGYIKKSSLHDDTFGYQKTGRVPRFLSVIFQDATVSENNIKVSITDSSDKYDLSEEVGEIVGVLGATVTSVVRSDMEGDCRISSENTYYRELFSKYLYCGNTDSNVEGNADVEVFIGGEYADRF